MVGCVDGTQIKIKAPYENEGDFINRKGFHALNVQVILVIKWRQLKWIIYFVLQLAQVLKVCGAYTYENWNQVILSYIIQMVCGPHFRISNVVAKWPGSVHDSRIFK